MLKALNQLLKTKPQTFSSHLMQMPLLDMLNAVDLLNEFDEAVLTHISETESPTEILRWKNRISKQKSLRTKLVERRLIRSD